MRVLIVTGIFPSDIGGPATYVPQIAAALATREHQVVVLTLSDHLNHEDRAHPFRVVRLRRGVFRPWRRFLTIHRLLRLGSKADVLFVNGLAFETALANLLLRKPVVQKVVGDLAWERATALGWVRDDFEVFQQRRYGLRVELLKVIRNWWTSRADRVIVPSSYLAQWVQTWGIPREKIAVIHNAVHLARNIRPTRLDLQASLNLVTVGRLVLWKRVDHLIETIRRTEGVGLLVVGDGPERRRLEAMASALNVQNRVHFAGALDGAKLASLMAGCDVFVLNSTYEGFPHAVLEAMSLGLAIVATAVGGTPEIIEDGRNGILIPVTGDGLGQAVETLFHDADLRRQLAVEGKRTVENQFSTTATADRTEKVLQDALRARCGG